MFRDSHLDHVRQAFADQFSANGNDWLYRRHQKGPLIRVSNTERNRFVAIFNKRVQHAMCSLVLATVGVVLLLFWLDPSSEGHTSEAASWAGIAAILVAFMAFFYWAWNAPSRELSRRTPEGAALTKEQARRLALSEITYGNLALAVLMGAGLIWKMSAETDVFHGWGLVWPVLGGGLIFLAGFQALRKWHLRR